VTIKNIIFDLGGVIIDIDYNKTCEAFRKLGVFNFDEIYTQIKQDPIFDDYETGKISSEAFRLELKSRLGITATDAEFDNAWNAMLLDLPLARLEYIKELRKNFVTILFSNTNDIHLQEVFNICDRQNGFNTFNDYFDKEYYSNIFRKRKPHPESFLAILEENGLNADETLFVDDTLQHVLGAREAGLHAVHITNGKSIFDVMSFIEEINQVHNEERSERGFSFAI
jgi:putative hydrolase of the HAD superfamily